MNDVAANVAFDAERCWSARLALSFRRRDECTVLARREHNGPLVVQKALHPEGAAVCQAIVVHPPGGIAGGDRLELDVDVGERAHAQLTTPSAAKWYRSTGRGASQMVQARVAAGGVLEWLPQEAIVFDGARVNLMTTIALDADAVFVGWDIVCLGRTHSGEHFGSGTLAQSTKVLRAGALLWVDRWVVEGGSRALQCGALLSGAPVFGTLIAAADIGDDVLASCRGVACAEGEGAATRLPGALVARYCGHDAAAARTYFANLWRLLRPGFAGRAAVPPRIWNT
jgi:urease accessory protein